jgi:hypothetical protein
MLNKKRLILPIFILMFIFSYSLLKAETEAEGQPQEKPVEQKMWLRQKLDQIIVVEAEEFHHEFDSYVRFMPSRGVDAMSGKVGINHRESEYSYQFKLYGEMPMEFSVNTAYIGIENTTNVELPAHLNTVSCGLEFTLPFFTLENAYLRTRIKPSFYDDDWNFRSSSFRLPFYTFAIFQPNERLTYILGVAVFPDFRDKVAPVLGFIYIPNDKLTFSITPERPNISYKMSDNLTLFAEGGFNSGEWEVTKDNIKNTILEYHERNLGAGVKYKFNKFIQGSLSAGSAFGRRLQYRDSLGKVNIKDGFYTELRMEIRI